MLVELIDGHVSKGAREKEGTEKKKKKGVSVHMQDLTKLYMKKYYILGISWCIHEPYMLCTYSVHLVIRTRPISVCDRPNTRSTKASTKSFSPSVH